MKCVICMQVRRDDPAAMVTVANGNAVCEFHLDYIIGWPDLDEAVSIARGNEPPREELR